MPQSPDTSYLLAEECFRMQDSRFIEALRGVTSAKWLAAFADRWKKDLRPWAREQIFAYLDLPMSCAGHQPVVKRLFKHAEENKDLELIGAFMVAFDVMVRRVRKQQWKWDRALRQSYTEEVLASPKDVIPTKDPHTTIDPRTGYRVETKRADWLKNKRLFTYRTRHYLRRRVWRFFRWLGFARPAEYPAAVANALRRYRDEDLAKGENILDSWALLNACFRGSDSLIFGPAHIALVEGRALSGLKAAPRFAKAWETPEAARVLHGLIVYARSNLVRMWAMELFRRVGSSLELTPDEVLALIDHADERVQQFGAEIFRTQGGLEKLPVATWLQLLATKNLTALGTLCEAFGKHVTVNRLSLQQCIELACAQPVPVARLGFGYLKERAIPSHENETLGALADAKCPAVAGEIAAWALARLGSAENYRRETVVRFFDSLIEETRDAAWSWLIADKSPGYRDAALWSQLAETPFEDLRLKFIDHLALREKRPDADKFAPIWCAVLLGVHRGGRQKAKAVRQIADAIADEPNRAAGLLPVLAVAIRSVRGPEMRAGIAAVMSLIARRPELATSVRAKLPELGFAETEVAA
jgi:hypothetical protein